MNSNSFQQRLLGLQDNLLNFAYMLTSNQEEAKDLLQDTTLKALDNEEKYIDNYCCPVKFQPARLIGRNASK